MKTFIPWLLALLMLGGAFYFRTTEQKAAQTITTLQQQVQELQTVREENEQLKAKQVSSNELERLRKDSSDVLKLRNEVSLLRGEQVKLKQLAQAAQNQTQQAQAQAQAIQAQLATMKPTAPVPQSLSPQGMLNHCLNNLRQIDGAKQQWALENRKTDNDTPVPQDVAAYLKNGVVPSCPAGGQYTLGRVSEEVTCSIPGHGLQQQ